MIQFKDLKRYPHRKNELLQAWDSADELLIEHLHSSEVSLENARILILNDSFGALSAGLKDFSIMTFTDSFVCARAIEMNTGQKIVPIHDLGLLSGIYDKVILKIPKNLSFLEDALYRITPHLNADSEVIAGAMVKHLPKGAFDLLEKIIGKTRTSLARKKARLIFAKFEKSVERSPYPLSVRLDSFATPFTNHSNLFSREKLDIGTRFFLEHIPEGQAKTILDLGCANGVVGIRAKQKNPRAKIIFIDDSAMAVDSARLNYAAYFKDETADFVWTNCFENGEADSVDLVLCNPPFHQQMVVGDFIATQMFEDSKRALKTNGVLRVIGNSHLPYGVQLKKIFGNSQKIAANSKFVIWDAVKMPTK